MTSIEGNTKPNLLVTADPKREEPVSWLDRTVDRINHAFHHEPPKQSPLGFGIPANARASIRPDRVKTIVIIACAVFAAAALVCLPYYTIASGVLLGLTILTVTGYFVAAKILNPWMDRRRTTTLEQLGAESSLRLLQSRKDIRQIGIGPALGHYSKDANGKGNTDLLITRTSDESIEWKYKLIQTAEKSLEWSASFAGGKIWDKSVDLIEAQLRSKPQLNVHIMLNDDFITVEQRKRLALLRKSFPGRFNYLITSRLFVISPRIQSEENHSKFLIIDGKSFVIGGTQTCDGQTEREDTGTTGKMDLYTGKMTRDNDVVGAGPLARVMRRQFFDLYTLWEGRTLRKRDKPVHNRFWYVEPGTTPEVLEKDVRLVKGVKAKFLVCGPGHAGLNPITGEYEKRLSHTEKEAILGHCWWNPSDRIKRAIRHTRKAHPKMRFELLTNGIGGNAPFSTRFFGWINRLHYTLPDIVYEYQKRATLYHRKVGLFDDKYMIIGSYNTSFKSDQTDYEVALEIKDEEGRVIPQMREILLADKAHCVRNPLENGARKLKQLYAGIVGGFQQKLSQAFIG